MLVENKGWLQVVRLGWIIYSYATWHSSRRSLTWEHETHLLQKRMNQVQLLALARPPFCSPPRPQTSNSVLSFQPALLLAQGTPYSALTVCDLEGSGDTGRPCATGGGEASLSRRAGTPTSRLSTGKRDCALKRAAAVDVNDITWKGRKPRRTRHCCWSREGQSVVSGAYESQFSVPLLSTSLVCHGTNYYLRCFHLLFRHKQGRFIPKEGTHNRINKQRTLSHKWLCIKRYLSCRERAPASVTQS